MAMKCCCIATNAGAIDEIIDNNVNGIIVEPGNTPELIDNINYLLQNEHERFKLAANGYNKVVANFTAIEMAKQTKKIYNQILK